MNTISQVYAARKAFQEAWKRPPDIVEIPTEMLDEIAQLQMGRIHNGHLLNCRIVEGDELKFKFNTNVAQNARMVK